MYNWHLKKYSLECFINFLKFKSDCFFRSYPFPITYTLFFSLNVHPLFTIFLSGHYILFSPLSMEEVWMPYSSRFPIIWWARLKQNHNRKRTSSYHLNSNHHFYTCAQWVYTFGSQWPLDKVILVVIYHNIHYPHINS